MPLRGVTLSFRHAAGNGCSAMTMFRWKLAGACAAIALALPAQAGDLECQDIASRYQEAKDAGSAIVATEFLFQAAGAGCGQLVEVLLADGGSVAMRGPQRRNRAPSRGGSRRRRYRDAPHRARSPSQPARPQRIDSALSGGRGQPCQDDLGSSSRRGPIPISRGAPE